MSVSFLISEGAGTPDGAWSPSSTPSSVWQTLQSPKLCPNTWHQEHSDSSAPCRGDQQEELWCVYSLKQISYLYTDRHGQNSHHSHVGDSKKLEPSMEKWDLLYSHPRKYYTAEGEAGTSTFIDQRGHVMKKNVKWKEANCRRMHTLWYHLYKVWKHAKTGLSIVSGNIHM